ncbi:hypothetical protein MUK42_06353 [Musa troglodytarum]|uniref:DUF569 domain-containing protein n=1 Tax=Musa troglodytarum TaxID=320322 RepID=A0A9E7H970_9LILI|nr:hypothetical protein MUK42_06353 [Musa troglodytarum]URE25797.1 hypothetical protein MUK42_06353 [Musa troglodytarum]URE25800.1 hypothetical protein MUK42_06353 [Musa troglodytarum]
MEFFARAKAVRLRSHHDKYLVAAEDEEHVTQDRDGTSRGVRWTVERVDSVPHVLRLRSCYGRYLTASNEPLLLGVTGKKVSQTLPARLDSSLEWEPLREGSQVKLKTRYGNYLRGNGGLPPWRNSVTHDVPHRTSTQDWILWDVDVIEILPQPARIPNQPVSASSAVSSSSASSSRLSSLESSDSFSGPLHKVEGRSIYFTVADDNGNVDDSVEWPHVTFIGTSVPELTQKLKEETKLDDIIVCTRNPLNQHLIPLYLHLPPNNTTMRLVVVDGNSKAAKKFSI